MRILLFILFGAFSFLFGCNTQKDKADKSEFRIAIDQDPESLDPRKVRTTTAVGLSHMLYEGLMRFDPFGNPIPALAQTFDVSNDNKMFTFHLKEAFWSNGERLTADDFVETFKSVLRPEFPAPNAYQLYVIKGAKSAKMGSIPLDDIGVHAPDQNTLVIELEESCPFFLSLAATHFMYPVHKSNRDGQINTAPICNGPFQLSSWQRNYQIELLPNKYFGEPSVIQSVLLQVLDENTALQLFKKKELDWIGSPLRAIGADATQPLMEANQLNVAPALGTFWMRLNTKSAVFASKNMRRSLSLALNRKELVKHVTYTGEPATGIVPKKMGLNPYPLLQDNEPQKAKNCLECALNEDCINPKDLTTIRLCYVQTDRNHKIAQVAKENWKKNLNIEVILQAVEAKLFYEKLAKGDFEISLGSWFADIPDPLNFLEVFKYKDNQTNNTGWEMKEYQELLEASNKSANNGERLKLLAKAETLLIEEMAVIPLYHATFNYLKSKNVENVFVSDLGFMEIRNARVIE